MKDKAFEGSFKEFIVCLTSLSSYDSCVYREQNLFLRLKGVLEVGEVLLKMEECSQEYFALFSSSICCILGLLRSSKKENNQCVQQYMQRAKEIKLSEKQFSKIPLFRQVRQVNGDKIFKILFSNSRVLSFSQRQIVSELAQKKYFVYVLKGEVVIYKKNPNIYEAKSLIKSFRIDECFGYQDFPLFWGEDICIQAKPTSSIIMVPLSLFYQSFRRVIPLNFIQSRAQYIKRLPLFREVQIQKIVKIATICQKYRAERGQILYEQGSMFKYILIIVSGKVQLTNKVILQPIIYDKNDTLLTSEMKEGLQQSLYTAKCTIQSDLIAIPRQEFKRIIDIRYKLKQSISKTIEKRQIVDEPYYLPSNKKSINRPKTSSNRVFFKRPRTQADQNSQKQLSMRKSKSIFRKLTEVVNNERSQETDKDKLGKSLSQIQWGKFIKRKQTLQSRIVTQYIKSKPPQTFLNPSKQFALIKPFYKGNSLYIKNQKRKLKKALSYSKNLSDKKNE